MKNEIKCPNCGTVFPIDESDYTRIVEQVRTDEFDQDVARRAKEIERQWAGCAEQAKLVADREKQAAVEQQRRQTEEQLREVTRLKGVIANAEAEKKLAVVNALSEKDAAMAEHERMIQALRGELEQAALSQQLAVSQARQESQELIAQLRQQKLDDEAHHADALRMRDQEIERIRDFRLAMSTKMVGESLEQYCLTEFNRVRMMAFPHAVFEKDNDAGTGSKGDFIYRETTEDGTEIISIMFEMKNEMDATAAKHKAEHFFRELDKDRKEKSCEYAVLVSMLEQDNEMYNAGIADVSYAYDKMYVIRPQCFIPMISLLRNAALRSLETRQELRASRQKEADFTRFEENMENFKKAFSYNVDQVQKRFTEAVADIDKAIKALQDTREKLMRSNAQLETADKKVSEMTVKRLTRGAPSILEQIRAAGDAPAENDDDDE